MSARTPPMKRRPKPAPAATRPTKKRAALPSSEAIVVAMPQVRRSEPHVVRAARSLKRCANSWADPAAPAKARVAHPPGNRLFVPTSRAANSGPSDNNRAATDHEESAARAATMNTPRATEGQRGGVGRNRYRWTTLEAVS